MMPAVAGKGCAVRRRIHSRRSSIEPIRQLFLDWAHRVMIGSAFVSVVLYIYLLQGLLVGSVDQWASIPQAAERMRILNAVEGGVLWLNISLGVLLVALCLLYYDEEILGYSLLVVAIFMYVGVPLLLESIYGDLVTRWSQTNNIAALKIHGQFQVAGIMAAIPGVLLTVRDLLWRMAEGSSRKRAQFRNLQYGAEVTAELPVGRALIPALAKCWQLPFCRDFIRVRCPIYHARTRCWRERVGCMCEEKVIRHAMDAMMREAAATKPEEPIDFAAPAPDERRIDLTGAPVATKKPRSLRPVVAEPKHIPRRQVKIPHNPNLSMAAKKERCRNCVIYNEHQRLKYQILAPLVVVAIPLAAIWYREEVARWLHALLEKVDSTLLRLSLHPGARSLDLADTLSPSNTVIGYIVAACLVVVLTTMALRALEYLVFRLKI
jgi:hypothetical protein